jgi:MYXO-CTERM domain-containing protein
MTDTEPANSEPGPDASAGDIKADIEATRDELGHTVEALSAKLDVKAQAKHKVDDTRILIADRAEAVRSKGSELGSRVVDVATDDQGSVRPVVPAAALAAVALVVGILVWRRRRR